MDKNPDIRIRAIPFKKHIEYNITLNGRKTERKFLEKLFLNLEKNKISVAKILCLGGPELLKKTGWINEYPVLFFGNSSKFNAKFKNASLHIQAVGGDLKDFKYVKISKKISGAFFSSGNLEYLSSVGLCDPKKFGKDQFLDEARGAYDKIQPVLSKCGFLPKNVYRFWNYLSDISENYVLFNKARNEYYQKHKIIRYPAATGVEAGLSNGRRITLGFEAIESRRKDAVRFKIIKSDMQCDARDYGPKFSRAILLHFPEDQIKKLYVSGTSSVNKKGKSILTENYRKNIIYVLSCMEHLLEKNSMSFENIATSHAYFKNKKLYSEFKHIYAENNWHFPYNPAFTNICRDNFLFEMECVAANKISEINPKILNG